MPTYTALRDLYDQARALVLSVEATARRHRVLESLTAEDERILRRLYGRPLTLSELAELAGQSTKQVGTTVRRLTARGFVAHRPNPAHVQSYRTGLTLAGRTVAHISLRRGGEFAAYLRAHLDAGDVDTTLRTLHRIVDLTGRV
jgi:DNA-binding MarR family transcriptional regulator